MDMTSEQEFRHGRIRVLVYTVDTDYPEFEEEQDLCRCQYTGALFMRGDGIYLGPIVPQAPCSYLCHPLAARSRLGSLKIFQEHEQNCNTCRYLQRIAFGRLMYPLSSGLQPGRCTNPQRQPLYPTGEDTILFAPTDCMLQPCYVGR